MNIEIIFKLFKILKEFFSIYLYLLYLKNFLNDIYIINWIKTF